MLRLSCPANIARFATSPAGAVVSYPAPIPSGGCTPYGAPVCNPPSGSTFPIGTTTVTCTVSDSCGQTADCSFTVKVQTAATADVFIDHNYTGKPNGTMVNFPDDNNPGPHKIGVDAFATLTGGIGATPAHGVCVVAAGTYPEYVAVNVPMTILGANAGIDPRNAPCAVGGRGAESIIDGMGIETAIAFKSSGITLDGFTIQNGGGADPMYQLWSGLHMGNGFDDNHVLNNIIKNTSFGIWADCAGPLPTEIRHNLIQANDLASPVGNAGIAADGSANLKIVENEFDNHTTTNPLLLEASGAGSHTGLVIVGNNLHNNPGFSSMYVLGVSGGVIASNQIDSTATCIRLASANNGVDVINNIFTAGSVGVRLVDDGYGFPKNANIRIHGNSFGAALGLAISRDTDNTGSDSDAIVDASISAPRAATDSKATSASSTWMCTARKSAQSESSARAST
jgi:hypothetical protein